MRQFSHNSGGTSSLPVMPIWLDRAKHILQDLSMSFTEVGVMWSVPNESLRILTSPIYGLTYYAYSILGIIH